MRVNENGLLRNCLLERERDRLLAGIRFGSRIERVREIKTHSGYTQQQQQHPQQWEKDCHLVLGRWMNVKKYIF